MSILWERGWGVLGGGGGGGWLVQRSTGGDFTRKSIPSMGCLGHLIKINFSGILGFSGFDSFILYGETGCLPFTWKTQKFQLENQMVHIIPFGVLLKIITPFGIYS